MQRVLFVLVLVGLSVPTLARAADPTPGGEDAVARALFEDGLAHADAGRWAEAADRFERARAIRDTPEIRYNLTTALLELGQFVRARELLRPVAADAEVSPEVRQAAAARMRNIEARLAHLTVLPPASDEASVWVDGQRLDPALLGVAQAVDPASYTIELQQGGSVVAHGKVTLHEGQRRSIRLAASAPVAQPSAQAVEQIPAPASASTGGPPLVLDLGASGPATPGSPADSGASRGFGRGRGWIWAVVGAVALGVTTATVMAVRDEADPVMGNVATWTLGEK